MDLPKADSASQFDTFSANLRWLQDQPGFVFELSDAALAAQSTEPRVFFDSQFGKVFVPEVTLDNNPDASFFAEMELVPNSNPVRFAVTKLHSTNFEGCPGFASPGAGNVCTLQGTLSGNVTLTNNAVWVLNGGVDVGGDRTDPSVLTVEPGTVVQGQSGADFLFINRGSQINAIGTPQKPVVFTGLGDDDSDTLLSGSWAGLVLAGESLVNGCSEGVAVCEQFDEALTRPYGGNNPNDNSGVLKYVQIRFAGFEIRPDNELNALTLLGVGSGTTVDFVQTHRGKDDGVEMFGGTVNLKHIVATGIDDDSLDWGQGWTGKGQFIFINLVDGFGDHGIEADNNEGDFNSLPRSKPQLANLTLIGSDTGRDGALLRRGTGVNINNAIFTNFTRSCLNIDSDATFENAGAPGALTGELTVENTVVDCTTNFNDDPAEPFLVSDWFTSQPGNIATNPNLNGFLPAVGSPAIGIGLHSFGADPFFAVTDYAGAFADENDDWTRDWTFFGTIPVGVR